MMSVWLSSGPENEGDRKPAAIENNAAPAIGASAAPRWKATASTKAGGEEVVSLNQQKHCSPVARKRRRPKEQLTCQLPRDLPTAIDLTKSHLIDLTKSYLPLAIDLTGSDDDDDKPNSVDFSSSSNDSGKGRAINSKCLSFASQDKKSHPHEQISINCAAGARPMQQSNDTARTVSHPFFRKLSSKQPKLSNKKRTKKKNAAPTTIIAQQRQHPKQQQQQHDEDFIDLSSHRQLTRHDVYNLKRFMGLWNATEASMDFSTEYLESCSGIRGANRSMSTTDSVSQERAQYGRILFEATDKLFNILELDPELDVFVDIGHGIGNTVLQAAMVRQCEARGIEVVSDRNAVAVSFQVDLYAQRQIHLERDNINYAVGSVDFRCGSLEAEEHRAFLTVPSPGKKRMKVFCNNYNSVFADLPAKPREKYYLDHYNAGLFALMPPGSIMVTLHKLDFVPPRSEIQAQRRKAGDLLSDHNSLNASFYEMEKVKLGATKDAVTWASGSNKSDLIVYKYRRIEQEPNQEEAVFQCWNPICSKAQAGTAIPATKTVKAVYTGELGIVTNSCDCNVSGMSLSLRSRNKVSDIN